MIKKVAACILCLCFITVCGCGIKNENADDLILKITENFELKGLVYSLDGKIGTKLDTSLLCMLFGESGGWKRFKYTVSCAAYFSQGFNDGEIIIAELSDVSHTDEIRVIFLRRAEKKKKAAVCVKGKLVCLVSGEKCDEIISFIKNN